MANSTAGRLKTANTTPEVNAMSVVAPALGWLIPGAGHIIQRRWIRGLLLLVSITSLFVLGVMMQGRIYRPNGGDILDMLGFIDYCADQGLPGAAISERAACIS